MGNTFCGACACVDQASIGVVEKWGRFYKLASPGFHFFNPLAGESLAGVLSTRISSLDVRIETKTKVSLLSYVFISFSFVLCLPNWSSPIDHCIGITCTLTSNIFSIVDQCYN